MAVALKPVSATVRESIETRDGGWRLRVRVDGSKVTALVPSPRPVPEGSRVDVIGADGSWALA